MKIKIRIFILVILALVTIGAFANYLNLRKNEIENEFTTLRSELALTKDELAATRSNYEYEMEKTNSLTADLEMANTIIESLKGEEYIVEYTVTQVEIEMLAKTVWGEARGCNRLEQSAVVWCILNRVDAGWGTIAEVITAPNQFHGYSSNFPVTDEIKELVEDVIARWKLEKVICGDVGRTLPSNYLYFCADDTGIGNIFRDAYSGSFNRWNWDCWNPYS